MKDGAGVNDGQAPFGSMLTCPKSGIFTPGSMISTSSSSGLLGKNHRTHSGGDCPELLLETTSE